MVPRCLFGVFDQAVCSCSASVYTRSRELRVAGPSETSRLGPKRHMFFAFHFFQKSLEFTSSFEIKKPYNKKLSSEASVSFRFGCSEDVPSVWERFFTGAGKRGGRRPGAWTKRSEARLFVTNEALPFCPLKEILFISTIWEILSIRVLRFFKSLISMTNNQSKLRLRHLWLWLPREASWGLSKEPHAKWLLVWNSIR